MEELRYKCPRCHYKTDDRTKYIKHLNRVNPCPSSHSDQTLSEILTSIKKPFQCPHCDKAFTLQTNLHRHRKTHTPEERAHIVPEPVAEPVAEPAPEPVPEPVAEPVVEPVPKPAPEPKIKQGVLYLATSSVLNGFKLGYWRGTHKSLYDRYRTCYGNSLEFYLFPCHDCRLLEAIAQTLFRSHNLSCELYCSEAIDHYKAVLSHLCVLPETELRKAAADPRSFIDDHPRSTTHAPVFTHVVPFRN